MFNSTCMFVGCGAYEFFQDDDEMNKDIFNRRDNSCSAADTKFQCLPKKTHTHVNPSVNKTSTPSSPPSTMSPLHTTFVLHRWCNTQDVLLAKTTLFFFQSKQQNRQGKF